MAFHMTIEQITNQVHESFQQRIDIIVILGLLAAIFSVLMAARMTRAMEPSTWTATCATILRSRLRSATIRFTACIPRKRLHE
jgi:hypothetical protein